MEIIFPIIIGTTSGLFVYGTIGLIFTRKTNQAKKFLTIAILSFIFFIISLLFYFFSICKLNVGVVPQ